MSTNKKYLASLDLDGTLLKDDKTISEYTKEFLRNFEKEGNFAVLNSGRAPRSVILYCKDIGIHGTFLSYNGAYAHAVSSDGKEFKIEHKLDKEILKFLYKKLVNKEIYSAMSESIDTIYYDKRNDDLMRFFNPDGMKVIQGDFDQILKEDPFIFMIQVNEPLKENQQKIQELFDTIPGYEVRFWGNSNLAEVYLTEVSKASTLEKIVEFCKVLDENVLVFGDADNDIEILERYPNSFAMINAYEDVKSHAKYITEFDNEHDGVAKEIEKIIYKNK